jgi:hypothetical protein
VDFRQAAGHGHGELRARAQARVRRERALNPHVRARGDPMVSEELSRERRGSRRVVAVGRDDIGGGNRELKKGGRDRRPETAKPPAQRPPQIQDAKVQTRVRLNVNGTRDGRGLAGDQEGLLTGSRHASIRGL